MLGPLAAPAHGAGTGPGSINPFEHRLWCRSCCVWFPSAQGCRGLLNPAGLSSNLGSGVTRGRGPFVEGCGEGEQAMPDPRAKE